MCDDSRRDSPTHQFVSPLQKFADLAPAAPLPSNLRPYRAGTSFYASYLTDCRCRCTDWWARLHLCDNLGGEVHLLKCAELA